MLKFGLRNVMWLLLSLNFCPIAIAASVPLKNIYVFGDSHASFNHRFVRDTEFTASNQITVLFKIRANPSLTMHQVGRDGLKALNLFKLGVRPGDVVIFDFGEVDCRTNIGKQRDLYHRELTEIIDTLATKYFATIIANRHLIPDLSCAVMSVLPPSDRGNNPQVPFHGQLSDRVQITKLLNQRLKELCQQHQLIFIDIYDLYRTPDGSLDHELSDGGVHVNPTFNRPIKELVVQTLVAYQVL